MLKKGLFILIGTLMLVGSYSCSTAKTAASHPETKENRYEIYPVPQHQTYLGTQFVITDEINVVFEETVDEATRNLLKNILNSHSFEVSMSDEAVSGKTNIIIGIKDGEGYADSYFDENISYDASTFEHIDAYVLAINAELGTDGTIAVLGKDTDAAYYGLTTLRLILKQLPSQKIQSLRYQDYADTQYRGFIEGFYGLPWSFQDRKSLMRFGSKFKMNTYIYAPKDDPYHSAQWRELYPENELKQLAELVEVGRANKVEFVWAIHPGFNMIDWDHYEEELDVLINKLEQLYSIGVRQFGLFMDDISLAKALENRELHVKLITDVANWAESKGDVGALIYTPPFYNQSWSEDEGKLYLKALRNVPENVEIVWTGDKVIGTANPKDMQWVKELIGQKPFMWLNWPVNDYTDSRLLLGQAEVLKPGTHNVVGIVSNPMGQAELSKIALFAVADYTWNVDDFNRKQSWVNSFKYVAPYVSEALRTIAHHMGTPSPKSFGPVLGESEYLKDELHTFVTQFSDEIAVDKIGYELIGEFDKILHAIKTFRRNVQNTRMLNEIDSWIHSLHFVARADKYAVKAAIALQNGNEDLAQYELARAKHALERSDNFNRTLIDGSEIIVEAGAKRLVPFAEELIQKIDDEL